jgi:signal transduction histidine kinase/DNA-binding response OmpR family regulator
MHAADVDPRVLVVDDDTDESVVLGTMLRDLAVGVVRVRSLEEALAANSADLAVAVVRIELAGDQGFEVASRLRAHDSTRSLPLLFVTAATPSEAEVRRAYELGAVDVLVTPIKPAIFRTKVGVLADCHRERRSAERRAEQLLVAERREHERRIAAARAGLDAATMRARMEGERRASERLQLVAEIATELLGTDDPRAVLATQAKRLADELGFDVLAAYRADERGRQLRRFIAIGVDDGDEELAIDGDPFTAELFARRGGWIGDASAPAASPLPPWLRGLRAASCFAFPLTTPDRALGMMIGGRLHGAIGADDLAAIRVVSLQLEHALERSRLVDELRRRAMALIEVDRRKNQFLDLLGHELRNPLAPIAYASALMTVHGPGDARFERLREVVESQARVLTRLVDDLLDVSRLGAGKIELVRAPISVNDVIERAIAASASVVAARGHELVVRPLEEDCEILADGARLARAVESLVENAARYTDPGGLIEVTARRARDEVRIAVSDNGSGIEPEDLPRIFDAFVRTADSRAHAGLGLGLPLVRGIVEMHGGSVVVHSGGRGRGSELVISLAIAGDGTAARQVAGDPREAAESAVVA